MVPLPLPLLGTNHLPHLFLCKPSIHFSFLSSLFSLSLCTYLTSINNPNEKTTTIFFMFLFGMWFTIERQQLGVWSGISYMPLGALSTSPPPPTLFSRPILITSLTQRPLSLHLSHSHPKYSLSLHISICI